MLARLAGAVLLLLGLLPIANWIPGGHEAPWYHDRLGMWTSGGAILLGVAVIVGIVLRRRPELWRDGLWHGMALRWQRGGWGGDAAVAVAALVAYLAVSHLVLSATPLLIDEIIQVYQARIFASGRLWIATPEHPEFTSAMHLVDMAGRRFGQFPAGGPAMLMLGTLVGAEWLVGPLFAALTVLAFARLLRWIEPRPGTALAALLLFAFCPFWFFLAGSMMNHVTATAWLMAAALALAMAVRDERARWPAALAAGLALGIAATIRPMDAVAFALPTAAWLCWRVRGGRAHVGALLASGIGVALPIAALLWVNNAQTGDPFLFGYIALWGKSHALGFHAVPWGAPHTPLRGVELINLYLLRLQSYLFETPAPALLFATAALLLVRRLTAFDRWVLTGSGLLLVAYWAYWHDGFYLGPRFLLPLAPWLALWTARLPAVLAERAVPRWWRGGVVTAGVVALTMGGGLLLPIRAGQYAQGMLSMRLDPGDAALRAGVREAVILVRESWGAKLMVQLWALGISPVDAELIYRGSDACELDQLVTDARVQGWPSERVRETALGGVQPRESLRRIDIAEDTTLRARPGSRFTPSCMRRLQEDSAGTALYPTVMNIDDGNLWVRELGEATLPVLKMSGTRPIWLMTQEPIDGGALRFERVDRDSVARVWGEE